MLVKIILAKQSALVTLTCLCTTEVAQEIPIPEKLRAFVNLAPSREMRVTVPGAFVCESCSHLIYEEIQRESRNGRAGQ